MTASCRELELASNFGPQWRQIEVVKPINSRPISNPISHGTAMRIFRIACLSWLFLGLALVCSAASLARDKTTVVPRDNEEMAEAIAKARATLPEFFSKLERPGPNEDGFALKVEIPADDGVASHELFWLINIVRNADGTLSGEINNDPNHTSRVKLGDRYAFGPADISDWLFMRNGKMVGNTTLRVLLKSMPPDEAARLRDLYEEP